MNMNEYILTEQTSSNATRCPATTRFPSPFNENMNDLTDELKIAAIEEHFKEIMNIIGLDTTDDSLAKTPYRVAKMYVKEIFSGLKKENFPAITSVEDRFRCNDDDMIIIKEITVNSTCEHHFLPFVGHASVAYIPNGTLIGLSKINRVVDYFCKRPQLQERLTAQIADSLQTILNTDSVAVSITAQHMCVTTRGISDTSSTTETHTLLGRFHDDKQLRHEFFARTSPS